MLYYFWDLDDACDAVEDILDCGGGISFREIVNIAYYYDVLVCDILNEFGWD